MTVYRLGDLTPDFDDSVYVAPNATIIGRVRSSASRLSCSTARRVPHPAGRARRLGALPFAWKSR